MSDNSDQLRFDTDGELEEPTDDDTSTDNLKDDGDPMGRFESKAGYNIFVLSSCLQKAIRRSDEQVAAWTAWELTRSGYAKMYWKRAFTIATEDVAVQDSVLPQVQALYRASTGQSDAVSGWSPGEDRGRIAAMRAAIACAQATSSRRTDYLNETFDLIADERVTATHEGREPRHDFPASNLDLGGPFDVIHDMHTASGSSNGRGYDHFLVHSSRTDNLTAGEAALKRQNMELVEASDEFSYTFSDDDYDHALSPIDEDASWMEPNLVQDTLDSE